MKNLLKIGALSLALIATVFMLNTKAATPGDVTLQITSVSGTCVYGTSVALGPYAVSYSAHEETGTFSPATRYCNDTEGLSNRTVTVTATTQLTGSITGSIPAANVYVRSTNANTLTSGACTVGTNATTPTSAASAVTVLNKSSAAGETCKISTNDVKLSVLIPAAQAVGYYTGTLSIDSPW
jgi:hypothetical protein